MKYIPAVFFFLIFCLVINDEPLKYVYEKMGWDNDNMLEEIVEDIIEHKTGINIDLTPEDDVER
jgi:hypothetical protein